jgi:hypothetical protein
VKFESWQNNFRPTYRQKIHNLLTIKIRIMKQKFGERFLLPIGLSFLSGSLLIITHFKSVPDSVAGLLFGIGIGLIASQKIKPTSC